MAGRDNLLRFLREQETGRNAVNEPTIELVEFGRAYGSRVELSAQERLAAGEETTTVIAMFQVRENAITRSLTSGDTLRARGKDWNIRGEVETGGNRRGNLKITAIRNRDG